METKKKNIINKEKILLIIGFILLLLSFVLFHYETILEVNNDIKALIETEKYKEKNKNISVNISVDYLEERQESNNQTNNYSNSTPSYIAFLEIDKINLKQGLLPKDNFYNYVDYHVQILNISDYPDIEHGNFILAGHSGTSSVAFFKNLYKLVLGDTAKVYYKNKIYTYNIVNIYNETKDGSVNIYRNSDKTTLTLITCTKNDKEHQTIYILELIGVENY